jgi:hypothetical protein
MQMVALRNLLENGPVAINLGLQEFAKSLQDQGKAVVHIDWSPPPEIEEELQDILDELL